MEAIQWVTEEFPTHRNREFFRPIREVSGVIREFAELIRDSLHSASAWSRVSASLCPPRMGLLAVAGGSSASMVAPLAAVGAHLALPPGSAGPIRVVASEVAFSSARALDVALEPASNSSVSCHVRYTLVLISSKGIDCSSPRAMHLVPLLWLTERAIRPIMTDSQLNTSSGGRHASRNCRPCGE